MPDPTKPLGPDNPWVNPAAPPDVEPDSEPGPDNQRNPDTGEPNVWVEDPYGPDPPGGRVEHPDAGVDPAKATPDQPGYDPHFDPKVSEPELPGPDPTVPIVDHSGDPNWVPPDYPDVEAPSDPATQRKNATLTMYALTVFVNGVAKWGFDGDDVGQMREQLKSFLLAPPWGRQDNPFVQVRVLDRVKQQWADLSGGTPPAGWDGMSTAEVRVMCGFGDKL